MRHEIYTEYSQCLLRDMTFECFGQGGKIVFAFPPQNGNCFDYASFGMIDALKDFIEDGKISVICPGSVDQESWSDRGGDNAHRSWVQEQYYYYIVNELLPRAYQIYPNSEKALSTGCSMGATHAAIFFFRRPDLFDSLISLSGTYHASFFFGGYMDERLYNNSPADFIKNLPPDHYYRDLYSHSRAVICSGQGAWEGDLLPSMRDFDKICKEQGIPVWFDYWGYDVNHDWPWWRKQIVYFMDKVLS